MAGYTATIAACGGKSKKSKVLQNYQSVDRTYGWMNWGVELRAFRFKKYCLFSFFHSLFCIVTDGDIIRLLKGVFGFVLECLKLQV